MTIHDWDIPLEVLQDIPKCQIPIENIKTLRDGYNAITTWCVNCLGPLIPVNRDARTYPVIAFSNMLDLAAEALGLDSVVIAEFTTHLLSDLHGSSDSSVGEVIRTLQTFEAYYNIFKITSDNSRSELSPISLSQQALLSIQTALSTHPEKTREIITEVFRGYSVSLDSLMGEIESERIIAAQREIESMIDWIERSSTLSQDWPISVPQMLNDISAILGYQGSLVTPTTPATNSRRLTLLGTLTDFYDRLQEGTLTAEEFDPIAMEVTTFLSQSEITPEDALLTELVSTIASQL